MPNYTLDKRLVLSFNLLHMVACFHVFMIDESVFQKPRKIWLNRSTPLEYSVREKLEINPGLSR